MDQDQLVESACREIVEYTQDRQAVLIFASGVKHAEHIQRVLQEKHGRGVRVRLRRDAGRRARRAAGPVPRRAVQTVCFERQPLKYLVNVNVLTTGFDAPNIDCVAHAAADDVAGALLPDAVGRGFRLHPGKQDCLVLDFGGNVLRHGPVDQIRVQERRRRRQRRRGAGQGVPRVPFA